MGSAYLCSCSISLQRMLVQYILIYQSRSRIKKWFDIITTNYQLYCTTNLNDMNFGKEFENFAVKHKGISSNALDDISNIIRPHLRPILWERPMNVAVMDVL